MKYPKEGTPRIDDDPVLTKESVTVFRESDSSITSLREEMGPALRLTLVPIPGNNMVPEVRGEVVDDPPTVSIPGNNMVPEVRGEVVDDPPAVSIPGNNVVPEVRGEVADDTPTVFILGNNMLPVVREEAREDLPTSVSFVPLAFVTLKYPLVTSARITHRPSIWTLGSLEFPTII